MPLFMMVCTDKPGALELRKATRDAHLAYVRDTGVVVQAGPLLDDAGEMAGSLIVLDLPDLTATLDWGKGDPYAKAGLFADVRVQEWKKVIG
ncbi:YciI family protein [Roseibaca sp. Y0-43]|uniref:YciI family protein n=1 Tax=Roseibaca sp. Y0-43 TaxID=2816854 RepID=UPI001D0CC7A8|nr:YciI family protein [Roseibaca sp. Y0-43]MCC1481426.1 YciI family protein [Roseibaca sp. Y0-43]